MSQFPALEDKRYRSIRAKHPDDKVTTAAEGQPSQRGPVYHMLEMEGASGHRREAATASMSVTFSRIPERVESSDVVEAFGQRGEIAATTELETWQRAPATGACNSRSEEGPQVQMLPAFFRLEGTNFVAKAIVGILSLSMLQDALQKTLLATEVDILEFVCCHSVYKCSYHQGHRYMALLLRVFEPPSRSSGQLLDADPMTAAKIEGGLLVEVQLREGDRLHFSTLFREIQTNFSKIQDKIMITGKLRYKPRPLPGKGEGLVLESIDYLEPSRSGIGGPQDSAAGKLASPITSEPIDEDMIEDVERLAEVLKTGFLDVQADAATATAALTCDAIFRTQLSEPSAGKAAHALCHASARLLVETEHRPARRQAAVTVANLASIPALCRFLLKSDPPLSYQKRGIVDSLVTLAMLRSKEEEEEEIGTRRECMRALIGLAKLRSTRNMPAMKSLRSSTPSGRGAECAKLLESLRICRDILARPATVA